MSTDADAINELIPESKVDSLENIRIITENFELIKALLKDIETRLVAAGI